MSRAEIKQKLRRKQKLEIILPSILLALSIALVVLPLQNLIAASRQQAGELELAMGDSKYHIYSADKCIGELKHTVAQGRLLALVFSAKMRIEEQNVENIANFRFQSFYNPLQQLVQAVVTLDYRDNFFKLTTENVHPIDLKIEANTPKLKFQRNVTIPGPILLEERIANEKYVLSYPKLNAILPNSSAKTGSSLLDTFELRIEAAAESKATCEQDSLNIDALKTTLNAMAPMLLKRGGLPKGIENIGL